jgi:hypothetical protein
MPAIDPPIHPSQTNGQHDVSPPVEREEFWTDGLTAAQRTDAQRPRSAADLEWDASVDEEAYEGATAYSPTSYRYSDGYMQQIRAGGMLPQVTIGKQTVETNIFVLRVCVKG